MCFLKKKPYGILLLSPITLFLCLFVFCANVNKGMDEGCRFPFDSQEKNSGFQQCLRVWVPGEVLIIAHGASLDTH